MKYVDALTPGVVPVIYGKKLKSGRSSRCKDNVGRFAVIPENAVKTTVKYINTFIALYVSVRMTSSDTYGL